MSKNYTPYVPKISAHAPLNLEGVLFLGHHRSKFRRIAKILSADATHTLCEVREWDGRNWIFLGIYRRPIALFNAEYEMGDAAYLVAHIKAVVEMEMEQRKHG